MPEPQQAYTGSEPLISMHFVPLYTLLFKVHVHVYTRGQLIFLWKSDCLGCAVLLCLIVCLTLLASFFLLSASLINMYCMHPDIYRANEVLMVMMRLLRMMLLGVAIRGVVSTATRLRITAHNRPGIRSLRLPTLLLVPIRGTLFWRVL